MPELADDFCQLLREVRNGSEDAVWALINEYGDAVREAVRNRLNQELRSKFDSMDFVQLVWGSVFRARDKLERFERPEELVGYLVVLRSARWAWSAAAGCGRSGMMWPASNPSKRC